MVEPACHFGGQGCQTIILVADICVFFSPATGMLNQRTDKVKVATIVLVADINVFFSPAIN